jgi:hypothetical protein
MHQRQDRDERGRLRPGHTANPNGRPRTSALAKLLEAAQAEAADCEIVIRWPRRPERPAAPADDRPPQPPEAA